MVEFLKLMQIILILKKFVIDKEIFNYKVERWFRGVTDSTNDFGSFGQGSNPCGAAKSN